MHIDSVGNWVASESNRIGYAVTNTNVIHEEYGPAILSTNLFFQCLIGTKSEIEIAPWLFDATLYSPNQVIITYVDMQQSHLGRIKLILKKKTWKELLVIGQSMVYATIYYEKKLCFVYRDDAYGEFKYVVIDADIKEHSVIDTTK